MTTVYSLRFSLSPENLDKIYEQAVHGVNYWAKYIGRHAQDPNVPCEATGIRVIDDETGRDYVFYAKELEQVLLEMCVDQKVKSCGETMQRVIDCLVLRGCADKLTPEVADWIIQKICLGEVLYG